MALVLDTGVLLSALNAKDAMHDDCVRLLRAERDLVVPEPVLVELGYLLARRAPGVWEQFCDDVSESRYCLFPTGSEGLGLASAVQVRFDDQRIGFVDAAVLVACEQLGEDKVATLDRRHFSVLKTVSGKTLEIVP